MSINVYLKDEVRKVEGFKVTPNKGGSGHDEMSLNGVHVFGGKGGLYLMWDENSAIPDELKDLVEEVSCYERIPQMGRRESGIYRHYSAECELTPQNDGNSKCPKWVYLLKVTAKSMEDIKAILHKVKTGAIRPDESYEGQQTGMSRAELEAKLQLVTDSFEVAASELERLESEHLRMSESVVKALSFVAKLNAETWPFCSKQRVTRTIAETLLPARQEKSEG